MMGGSFHQRGTMMTDYIRRQDAIDAFNRIKNTLKNPETAHYDTLMFYEIEDVLEDVEPADVAPMEILKAEIYKLKCQQDSKNQDYYTGYMSALSTVEWILAEMGKE